MILSKRVTAVALGLVVVGAIAGACCACLATLLIVIADSGPRSIPELLSYEGLQSFRVVAGIGAAAGALGAPLLGFSVLRRVRLSRAILITALSATIGALVGEFCSWTLYPSDTLSAPGALFGALLGVLASGLVLRLKNRGASSGS